MKSSKSSPLPAVRMRSDIMAMQGYSFSSGTLESLSERYQRPIDEIIKLDTNENPYGPSPKAVEAVQQLNPEFSVYPDHRSVHLRELLMDYTQVDAEHMMVSGGSDQLIELTLRLFMEQDDCVINCQPTFTMYHLTADWMGYRVVNVPRFPDYSLDIEGIEQATHQNAGKAKILFLCSPNNPTGNLMPLHQLERLLDLPLVVVVDEAYWEFTNTENLATLVPHTPNLVITRTFSKWAGLAGLRIGYGIYPIEMMEHLWKIKPPFNVTTAADVAARATLQDLPYMRNHIQKILMERERLFNQLDTISYLTPLPSAANYIYCHINGVDINRIQETLEADAILIRYYPKGNPPSIRITVGKPEHTDRLIAALRQLEATHA